MSEEELTTVMDTLENPQEEDKEEETPAVVSNNVENVSGGRRSSKRTSSSIRRDITRSSTVVDAVAKKEEVFGNVQPNTESANNAPGAVSRRTLQKKQHPPQAQANRIIFILR